MTSSIGTFTYWSLLGVTSASDPEQVKRAFRREAMRWHPDRNRNDPVAEERFKWINEAYSVLSDPARRLAWEAAGRPAFQIREIPLKNIAKVSDQVDASPVSNASSSFNHAEKLLLILISISALIFLNIYVL